MSKPHNMRRIGGPRRGVIRWIIPLLLLGYFAWQNYQASNNSSRFDAQPISATTHAVERVVDGDTLILLIEDPPGSAPRRERLRLLGIDTPETVKEGTPVEPWGPEASEFTKQFVSGGKVRLEFDKRRVDQYDRYLAYVYVGDRMLNEALVAEGLARVDAYPGDNATILRVLKKAEASAREAKKGIWSE